MASLLARTLCSRMLPHRNLAAGVSKQYTTTKFRTPVMDDLPVPCGCFIDNYKAKNKTYNIILGLGVIIFSLTCAFAFPTGYIRFSYWPPNDIHIGPEDFEE